MKTYYFLDQIDVMWQYTDSEVKFKDCITSNIKTIALDENVFLKENNDANLS